MLKGKPCPILVLDFEYNIIKEFRSIKKADEFFDDITTITIKYFLDSGAMDHRRRYWKYKEKYNEKI